MALKILIVAHEYPPHGSGIANLVRCMQETLEQKRHTVDVCSPDGPELRVGSRQAITRAGGLGIVFFWIHAGRRLRSLQHDYDVIWLHNPLLLTKLDERNVFVTTHTLYKDVYANYAHLNASIGKRLFYTVLCAIESWSYRTFMNHLHISVTSKKTIDELAEYGYPRTAPIIPNGAKSIRITNRMQLKRTFCRQHGIPEERLLFMFIGRFDEQKNLFALLDTFKRIDEQSPQTYALVLVGYGDLENDLIDHSNAQRIHNVFFVGKMPHEQLMRTYCVGDFFFSASHYEGYPLTLAEGLSQGLIPILSPLGIFKDMVRTTGAGVIVDFAHPSTAAKKIHTYIKNTHLTHERKRLQAYMRKTYAYSVIANAYIAYFKNSLRSQASRRP